MLLGIMNVQHDTQLRNFVLIYTVAFDPFYFRRETWVMASYVFA